MDTKQQLSKVTLTLHWLVAIAIISIFSVGFYMSRWEAWSLYPLHKSFGVLVLALVLPRVVWRLKNGWPKPVRDYSKFEHLLARLVHWVLIIATVAMPISGMVYSGASGHGFAVFGLDIVHSNYDLLDPSKVVPYSEFWRNIGHKMHEMGSNVLLAAIVLHILAALKHHLLDKDGTLLRMLGKVVD